jgi:hypothetical protein
MKFNNILLAASAAVLLFSNVASASVIRYDVNHEQTNNTLTGWTAVGITGGNNVTFGSVGGAIMESRDRGTQNTNTGDTANNDMWRDFIFARNASNGPSGMDIFISGLLQNHNYSVDLWAFDEASDGSRNMTWNGMALNIPSSPDPLSLAQQTVSFFALSDGNGVLTLNGRVGSPQGACCNVFVNGFQVTSVPEPSAIAFLALAIFGIRIAGRRTK